MIELSHIRKTYQTGPSQVHALDGVSLTVGDGELVAIVGQSGSGKSTLMNILGLLDTPTSGEYRLDGRLVSQLTYDQRSRLRSKQIGFVFQGFHLLPRMTAQENVELPLVYAGISPDARREIAAHALEQVGLSRRAQHKPSEMSGGQQQRVAIARAIVRNPSIILADEPTGNLDAASGAEVLNLLLELNRDGATVILITHDPDVAKRARRVVQIREGRVASDREVLAQIEK